MPRPRRRRPPRESVDNWALAYDFSPRHGWGTYRSRGEKRDSVLVWEDRPHVGQTNTIVQLLPTETLGAMTQLLKSMGGTAV